MKRLCRLLAVVMISAISCTVVWAAPPVQNQRLCKEDDIIQSTWKMVVFREMPERKEATWYKAIPYHYLTFYPDHYYAFVASPHEIQTPQQLMKAMEWPQKANKTLKYTLDDKGVLDLYIDKMVKYRYRCFAIKETQSSYKKGDLVFTGYTRDARSELYKLYRRWF